MKPYMTNKQLVDAAEAIAPGRDWRLPEGGMIRTYRGEFPRWRIESGNEFHEGSVSILGNDHIYQIEASHDSTVEDIKTKAKVLKAAMEILEAAP